MIQLSGLKTFAQRAKSFDRLPDPLRNLFRIFCAPRFKFLLVGGNGYDEFHSVEAGQPRQRGFGRPGRATAFRGLPFCFVQRLGGFQQQPLVGIENRPLPFRFGLEDFKITCVPGKNFAKGGLARQVLRCGVDQIAVFEPDFAGQRAVGDFEHRGTLRQAFQLDDVHQTFTLHAAEPAGVGLPVEQRFDAVDEEVDFPARVRLFQKQVDAHGVGARAELRVHNRSHDRRAELRKFAPHDGQHLEPVHLGHVQVRDQE